jgi:purine-binding chemotaxis protein CheW
MSDDDERMDRARRIREMREGRRDSPEESSDETPAGEDESTAGADTEPEAEETGEPDTGETADSDAEETARSTDTGAAPEPATDETVAQSTDGGAAETDDTDHGTSTADADRETTADDADSEFAVETAVDDESAWFDEDDGGGTDGGSEGTPEDDGNGESAAAKAAAAAAEFESVDAAGEPDTTLEQLESEAEEHDAEAVEESDTEAGDQAGTSAAPTAAETESKDEEEIRVLEFELGGERYCLNIMYVEEIVKKDHITRVPNTPEFVRGVVDLRGQITTILDPKESIGIDAESEEELIIVFDGDTFEDQGYIGWLVDEVRQVTPIVPSEVKESPTDRKHVNGVIERDNEFVIWTNPEIALAEADADEES